MTPHFFSRIRHPGQKPCSASTGAQGFILPVMLVASLVVSLGAATLASRALTLQLGNGQHDQAREARDAADSGFEAVISELNRPENRSLAAANLPISDWGNAKTFYCTDPDTPPEPVQASEEAKSLSRGDWQTLPGYPRKLQNNQTTATLQYRIVAGKVKSDDRSNWIKTEFPTAGGTPTISKGGNYDPKAAPTSIPNPANPTYRHSYLELTIEGQSLRNGTLMASSRITQELILKETNCPYSGVTQPKAYQWFVRGSTFRSVYGAS